MMLPSLSFRVFHSIRAEYSTVFVQSGPSQGILGSSGPEWSRGWPYLEGQSAQDPCPKHFLLFQEISPQYSPPVGTALLSVATAT